MTKDLTEGKPFPLIFKFAMPLLFGNIFQQLYNIVDAVIVGKFLGLNALSGVGASASLNFLIFGFCIGMCSGFAIPIAQQFGAKNFRRMREFITGSTYLAAIVAALLTTATALLTKPILHAMGTPAVIFDDAYIYLFVTFLGIPFTILYNMLAFMLRALGDSRTPFLFLLLSTVINIFGDLFCIVVLHLGVFGAAIATVASQAISGILCLIFIFKKYEIVHATKDEWKFNHENNRILLGMGIPTGLVASITSIGSIMLQAAVNGIDVESVQAYAAALKIKFFFISPYDAIGNATATYVGQNLGAGKFDRIKKGVRVGIYMGLVYSVAACIILLLFSGNIASLFMDKSNTVVLAKVNEFMHITSLFYIVISFLNVHRCALQGMGYSKLAMYGGICEMVARTAMSLFVIPRVGFIGVCFTDQTAWIAATVLVTIAFYVVLKKERAIYQCSGSRDMQDK